MRFDLQIRGAVFLAVALIPALAIAQDEQPAGFAELKAHIDLPARQKQDHPRAAVIWLKALSAADPARTVSPGRFTLVQKNRMFTPHLLVVPLGSVVAFPNADPFFHNVFSLFNGKRFDLGLYEAGKSKDVTFSREGVSFIFCNIHPEMSAVVIALSTPYYAVADRDENFHVDNVPPGDYELRVWIDGLTQASLDRLTKRVHLAPHKSQSISLDARNSSTEPSSHLNKFGQQYGQDPKSPY